MEESMSKVLISILVVCSLTVPAFAQVAPGQPTSPRQTAPGSPVILSPQSPSGSPLIPSSPPAPGLPVGSQPQPGSGDQTQPGTEAREWVRVKNLKNGDKLISKKPEFEAEIISEIKPGSLMVMVDNVDVTQIAEISGNRMAYRPFMVMPAGTHLLTFSAQDPQGNPLQQTISFSTRHTVRFEEAASTNEVTGLYEALMVKTDTTMGSTAGVAPSTGTLPYSRVEGNWSTDNRIKDADWELSLKGNLRYFDQDQPVVYPLQYGVFPANYLLSGKYRKETYGLGVDFGDVMINESQYTAQNLARRGGLLSTNYKGFDFRAFSVLSQPVIGFYDGLGVHPTTDDHINGLSAGLKLLDKRMEFRAIYFKGGETPATFRTITSPAAGTIPAAPGNLLGTTPGATPGTGLSGSITPVSPYGLSTTLGRKEGEVAGFLFNTDFLQSKLKSEVELAFSRFDPDLSDQVGFKDDKAYRLKLGGLYDKFTYEAFYEYIGKDFDVIGTWIQKDKQGMTVRGGAVFPTQSVNLTMTRFNDNVTGNPLYPRLVTTQGLVDYNYTRFSSFPINLNFSKTVQDPYDIPTGSTAPKSDTNTISGRINYMALPWNIGFQTALSRQDDQSLFNNDTTLRTFTLTPMVSYPTFGISCSLSLNQTEYQQGNYRTDNFLLNLQLTGKLFNSRVTYELGNTYNILKSTNNSSDTRMLTRNFRLGYFLGRFFNGLFNPTVGVRGQYNHLIDNVNFSTARDDFALFLFISTSMPFSF